MKKTTMATVALAAMRKHFGAVDPELTIEPRNKVYILACHGCGVIHSETAQFLSSPISLGATLPDGSQLGLGAVGCPACRESGRIRFVWENNDYGPAMEALRKNVLAYASIPARMQIAKAEAQLGPLTDGQRTDLLLDNFEWLPGVAEARALVNACREFAPACTNCNMTLDTAADFSNLRDEAGRVVCCEYEEAVQS
jgi:hypothetical protein